MIGIEVTLAYSGTQLEGSYTWVTRLEFVS